MSNSRQKLVRALTELNEARWEAGGRLKMTGRYTTAGFPGDGGLTPFCSIMIIGKPTLQMNIKVEKFEM